MIPIVVGVAMTWYSDMIEVSRSALVVSVACIVLNAIRVVINSEMLTGESKVRKNTHTHFVVFSGFHLGKEVSMIYTYRSCRKRRVAGGEGMVHGDE